MSRRADRPSLRSRVTLAAGVASLLVVAVAARRPDTQATPPQGTPPQPPASAPAPAVAPMDSMAHADSMPADSMPMAHDMAAMAAPAAPAMPVGPAGYPVDPVTGQTLINGVPVVGRVFIQQKVDGLVKIASVAAYQAPEALPPEAPVVAHSQAAIPAVNIRRQRTIMTQGTLWLDDHKPSAVRRRHYRETTSGASLGQR